MYRRVRKYRFLIVNFWRTNATRFFPSRDTVVKSNTDTHAMVISRTFETNRANPGFLFGSWFRICYRCWCTHFNACGVFWYIISFAMGSPFSFCIIAETKFFWFWEHF